MEEMENVLLERIVQRQINANEKILKEIGEILGKIGDLTPSEAYTIGQQLKYGESLDKIIKTISKYSKINEEEIYRMFKAEARKNYELSKVYFKARKIDFIPFNKNKLLKNRIKEIALATAETYRNISHTTGLTFLNRNGKRITKGIRDAYYEIVDDAIMNVSTGKETFYYGLKNQLKTIGQAGVQAIEYESGYHRRIDSAMRLNLQEGLTRLSMAQQELIGQQFESDGVEITVHEFPAPDHEDVQGHIFTNEEFKKLQEDGIAKDINNVEYNLHLTSSKTGEEYSSHRPIGELNCYHYKFNIIIGVSEPRYTEKKLKAIKDRNEKGCNIDGKHYTLYQGTQLQRRLELEIRKTRETDILNKSALNNTKNEEGKQQILDAINKNKKRQQTYFNKYHDLSKISGLPTKLERTRLLIK